ncbi:hypothetical protein GGP66_001080 [Salinibacter ruber]|nr:hypothetical protein [Salinibacter ruber]MCS3782895.1 hypothetical protein [Salinibacter ruber]
MTPIPNVRSETPPPWLKPECDQQPHHPEKRERGPEGKVTHANAGQGCRGGIEICLRGLVRISFWGFPFEQQRHDGTRRSECEQFYLGQNI